MPIIQPARARHSIQEEGLTLKIIIPSRKNILIIAFLFFWLFVWAIGEVTVGGIIFSSIVGLFSKVPEIMNNWLTNLPSGGIFLFVWFAGWTVGGAFAIYTFLWTLVGKEITEINSDGIKIQRSIFGLGRKREYLAGYIKDIRIAPTAFDSNIFGRNRGNNIMRIPEGLLAFDYGAQTFRFGSGVDEAEAKQIFEKIRARFPQYVSRRVEAV